MRARGVARRRARACWRPEPGAWMPFAGGTDLMVLLEAGKLPEAPLRQPVGTAEALRGIDVTDGRRDARRADDLLATCCDSTLLRGVSAVCAAAARNRRHRDPEPRHDRRQHRQRVARRRLCRRRCSSTTPSWSSCRSAGTRRVPYADVPHRLQEDGPRGRRADHRRHDPPRPRTAGVRRTARSARAARRRSRRSALPPRRRSTARSCATCASPSAASRRRSSAARTPKRRCAAGRSTHEAISRRAHALARDIAPDRRHSLDGELPSARRG